jgi:hypothetical protein
MISDMTAWMLLPATMGALIAFGACGDEITDAERKNLDELRVELAAGGWGRTCDELRETLQRWRNGIMPRFSEIRPALADAAADLVADELRSREC